MSAEVRRPITSPADLHQFVHFGGRSFPVDTAVEWRAELSYTPIFNPLGEPKKQVYTVVVLADTLQDGKPYTYAEYEFNADTMQKATAIIHTLKEYNVKWALRLTSVAPSMERRAIRLTFWEGWAGTVVNHDGSTSERSHADVFRQFGGAAGIESDEYQVSDAGPNTVDLLFKDGLPEETLRAQMLLTLQRMERLVAHNLIHTRLGQNDAFHIEPDPDVKFANIADTCHFMDIGNDGTNIRCPIFKITETSIQGKHHYMGGGDSVWTVDDIHYLISQNKTAPQKDELEEKDEAGDDGDELDFLDALKLRPSDAGDSGAALPAGGTELDLSAALAMDPRAAASAGPAAGSADLDRS